MPDPDGLCVLCHGSGWVCEAHPDEPFNHPGCVGAGEPCPACNPLSPEQHQEED